MRLEPETIERLTKALVRDNMRITATRASKSIVYDPACCESLVRVDFEDTRVELPQMNGRGGIEPTFGGYKKILEVSGFILHGAFPIQHCEHNIWLCSVDVVARAHTGDSNE